MKIYLILLIIIFHGCGAAINFSQHRKPQVYTRISNTIFFDNVAKQNKVFIVIKNATSYSSFNDILQIIKNKIKNPIKIVDNPSESDIIIYANIRHFSRINPETIENIEKYWNYYDTTDSSTLKDINSNTFAISDGGVGFTDSQNASSLTTKSTKPEHTILTKITHNDFASGMLLGGVSGFFITGSNPVGAAIGAMIGGASSFVLQTSTHPSSYLAIADLEISQKANQNIKYSEKFIHKQDDNGMRWHNIESNQNLKKSRVKIYAVMKGSLLDDKLASSIATDKISESIANNL